MLHHSFYNFLLQKRNLHCFRIFEDLLASDRLALACGHLSHFDEHHQSEDRKFFVLVLKDKQRKKFSLSEAPLRQKLPDNRLGVVVIFAVFY